MPSVNPKESQQHYVSRCVKYIMDHEKGTTQKQALGKCYGMYKQSKKHKQSKGGCSDCEPCFEEDIKNLTFEKDGFEGQIEIN